MSIPYEQSTRFGILIVAGVLNTLVANPTKQAHDQCALTGQRAGGLQLQLITRSHARYVPRHVWRSVTGAREVLRYDMMHLHKQY